MNFILVTLALLIQLDCGKTCTNTCNNAQAQRNDTDRSRVSMEYFKSKSETCRFDLGKNSTTLSLVSHIGKKRRRYIGGFKLYYGASVAKWLAHLPFTSEAAGSNLTKYFLNATRTQSSCEKSKSQRSAESRGFSPGTPVSSHRES
jgi:hypothetical protein